MTKHTLKSLGLTGLLLTLVLTLETKSALGALHAVVDPVSAWQHAALSLSCALLAFAFSTLAGRFKADIRPHVRSSATLARLVSIAFLIVPTCYLGASLKIDRIDREWAAYYSTDAYRADVRLANDEMADRMDRAEAVFRITKPAGGLSAADGEFWLALALQVLVISAAGIPVHAPATDEEVKHWRAVARGRKAAATRKRRKMAKAKKPTLRVVASK